MDELQLLKIEAEELDYEIALAKFNGHKDVDVLEERLHDVEKEIHDMTHVGIGEIDRNI